MFLPIKFFFMENEIFFYILLYVLGSCLGSLANVIIYRMPEEKSILFPGSHCPHCGKSIRWFDLIPVFSYFILRGKSRCCKKSFSFRYPLNELLLGLLFCGLFFYLGWCWFFLECLIFIFALLCCFWIDFDHYILPDEFTLSGIVIGLIGAYLNPERQILDAVFGILMGGGFFFLTALIYQFLTKREGIGGGDIKLLAWIGAVLGYKAIPFIILVSAITGSVVGLAISYKSKEGLKAVIPYGPFLAFSAVLFIFGGRVWALEYWSLFFA